MIEIYVDGSATNKPNTPGGWGAVFISSESPKVICYYGYDYEAPTNNGAELTAALKALEKIFQANSPTDKYILYTDSSYFFNGYVKWMHQWKQKNWESYSGTEVKNLSLWQHIYSLWKMLDIQVEVKWIKAHNGHQFNELADRLAKFSRDNKKYRRALAAQIVNCISESGDLTIEIKNEK